MAAFNLPSLLVLEHGAMAGTLAWADVIRSLRRARHGLTASALLSSDPIDPPADPKLPESTVAAPVGIEERAPALFEPDVLLPDQLRRRAELDPERRLMVAVLEQGVNDYLRHAGAREPRELELWHEIEAWVEDRDASWLFSFENICHVLDLDPDYLRRGLHAHKERARGSAPDKTATPAGPADTGPERARATSG
jgi:hypothetical protein